METYCKKLDGIICPNCTFDISQCLSRTEGIGQVILFSVRFLLLLGLLFGIVSQSLVDGLLLRSFFAFLCAERCLACPIANIFEPL